jgi:hypothetical protein
MARESTPPVRKEGRQRITVKRCCERCDRELGDATEEELDAAVEGLHLPNVADECGCLIASLAVLTVADHQDDTVLPLALGGGVHEGLCSCGQTYRVQPGTTFAQALQAHQAQAVHAVLRANR